MKTNKFTALKPLVLAVAGIALLGAPAAFAQQAQPAQQAQQQGAQRFPIVVVDLDQVLGQSAAGRSASSALEARKKELVTRAQSLSKQFESEGQQLAQQQSVMQQQAFEQKVQEFQKRREGAQQELAGRQTGLVASEQYVIDQILAGATPIIQQLMKERGAAIALNRGSTVAAAASLDITKDVISRLDQQLKTVSIDPPAGAAKQ